MSDPMDNIYSPENIARSRARAASMREMVAAGTLGPEHFQIADDMDQYADEREAKAMSGVYQ